MSSIVMAAPLIPHKIGGTVTVNGIGLTQSTDDGYTFEVRRPDGSAYAPVAEDVDGLNASGFYVINIPIYEANDQPGGAIPGETAVIHVYKNGSETGLTIIQPPNGEMVIGESGTINSTIDLEDEAIDNLPPTADAGPDQSVEEGTTVTLDGSNSSDAVSYLWTQIYGTPVVLSDPTSMMPTFVPSPVDVEGDILTFELQVQNGAGIVDSEQVNVSIQDNGITGFPDDTISFRSFTNNNLSIKCNNGDIVELKTVDPDSITEITNKPDNLILGLIDVVAKVQAPGSR